MAEYEDELKLFEFAKSLIKSRNSIDEKLALMQIVPVGDVGDSIWQIVLEVTFDRTTVRDALGALDKKMADAQEAKRVAERFAKSYGGFFAPAKPLVIGIAKGSGECSYSTSKLFQSMPDLEMPVNPSGGLFAPAEPLVIGIDKGSGGFCEERRFPAPVIPHVTPGNDKGIGECSSSASKLPKSMPDSEMPTPAIPRSEMESGKQPLVVQGVGRSKSPAKLPSGLTGASNTSKIMLPTSTKPIPEVRVGMPHSIPGIDKQSLELGIPTLRHPLAKMKAPQWMSDWAMRMSATAPFGESESDLIELVKIISGLAGGAFLSFARNMPSSSSSKWLHYGTACADVVSFWCCLLCFLLYKKKPGLARFMGAIGCIAFVLTFALSVASIF